LENKDFFDYCRNALHKDFFIVPKHNNVKIKEFKDRVKIGGRKDGKKVIKLFYQ